MGLFLTQLALKNDSRDSVVETIISIMKKKGFILESKDKASQITGKDNEFYITSNRKGWIQIFCPEIPEDSLPRELSKILNTPIFQFHIHDGDFWMYKLFVSGKLVDQHQPLLGYNKKLRKKGDAKILSRIFKVKVSKIDPYLIFWENINNKDNPKAFSTDEYPIKNEWSMIDFQKKLGIMYPDFEKPNVNMIRLKFRTSTINKIKSIFKK